LAKNKCELTSACLSSIFSKTSYPNFEVLLVDNGSSDQAAFDLYKHYESIQGSQFRVFYDNRSFNFARMNNSAVRSAAGTYVVLLNNDTEIITPNWLQEMLMVAQFPEVGAVGCRLLYPNSTTQHGGVLLTDRLIAQHAGIGVQRNVPMYCNMLQTLHEVSAVTGACLFIQKEKYHTVGGLDETWVPNGYGDIDFCLRLKAKGLVSLYTPYAELIHHESPTRNTNNETFERQYMIEKHGHALMNEPYLNPNLKRNPYYEFDPSAMIFELDGPQFSKLLNTPPELWQELVEPLH
jgi:GT2 family glycosyltransferase